MVMGSALLIAGTTSDAGKSVITAGLCRAFARAGLRVAPFKAQNMSNNSVVTSDGGEIGRAQALQALACGLEPSVEFNPILLKPGPDNRARLVMMGREHGDVGAGDYVRHRHDLRGIAATQLENLRTNFDLVVCEGAGSPAEINLRATDVANLGLAQAAQIPVYIVGDIDRGGVLAHLFGTHAIISDEDRALIRGFVINKFRGDQDLLEPGLVQLEELTGVRTKAVIPFIDDIWIDGEDSLQSPVGRVVGPGGHHPLGAQRLTVAALRLPRMAGATDAEALATEPGVTVTWVDDVDAVSDADLVIIPDTTAAVADLAWLRHRGLHRALGDRATRGMPILGIGAGYQMMATTITDQGRHPGEQAWAEGEGVRRQACFGTHRQGCLEDDPARRWFLREVAARAGKSGFIVSPDTSFNGVRLQQLDRIADVVEECWDLDQLLDEVSNPASVASTPDTI